MNNTIQNTNNQNLLSNPNIMSNRGRPSMNLRRLFKLPRGRPAKVITQVMKLHERSSEILKDLREIKKQLRRPIIFVSSFEKDRLREKKKQLNDERKDILQKLRNFPVDQEQNIQERLRQQEERYNEQQRQEQMERERQIRNKLYLRFIPPIDPF